MNYELTEKILSQLEKKHGVVNIYLQSGVKLQGRVFRHDMLSVLIDRSMSRSSTPVKPQLVYFSASACLEPVSEIKLD